MTDPLRAITEGVLAEIEDAARAARQSDDPVVLQAYAQRAANEDVPQLTKVLRKAVSNAERKLERLAALRSDIDRALFDPKSYDGPSKNLTMTDLMKQRAEIEKAFNNAEARWLEANEALESASAAAL